MSLLSQITAEKKDEVLKYIIENYRESFGIGRRLGKTIFGIDEISLNIILDQFEHSGFLKQTILSSGILVKLNARAIDFYKKGGFKWQETLLLHQVDKLILEIETLKKELEPKHLETANKVATIAGAIASYLSFLKK